jgi:uncharacterized protein
MSEHPARLRITLPELRRGLVELERELDAPATDWEDLPDGWEGPLTVRAEASLAEDGSVRVVGRLLGAVVLDCRRCLIPVSIDIDAPFEAWFRPEGWAGGDEDSVWPLEPDAGEVDLAPVVREEVLLAVPDFAVCRPDCPGLCPRCGARLESEECECPPPGSDPRWDALEAVRASLTGLEDAPESG